MGDVIAYVTIVGIDEAMPAGCGNGLRLTYRAVLLDESDSVVSAPRLNELPSVPIWFDDTWDEILGKVAADIGAGDVRIYGDAGGDVRLMYGRSSVHG